MAIYNQVTDLYDDIISYMNRNESSITERVPRWVNMAEDELDRRLRHPAAVVVSEYTLTAGGSEIPTTTNLLELKYIKVKGDDEPLYKRSMETLYTRPYPYYDGVPTAFASRGDKFILNTTVKSDVTFEVAYYASQPKLSQSNTTNLYLNSVSDFLLYNALFRGFMYDSNPEEAQYYKALSEEALSALIEQINEEDIAGSTMVTFGNSDYTDYYY